MLFYTPYIHSGQNRPMILFEKVDGVFPHKHMCTYVINIRKVAWIQFIIVPVCLPIFRQMRHSALPQRRESSSLQECNFKSNKILENLVKSQSGHDEIPFAINSWCNKFPWKTRQITKWSCRKILWISCSDWNKLEKCFKSRDFWDQCQFVIYRGGFWMVDERFAVCLLIYVWQEWQISVKFFEFCW